MTSSVELNESQRQAESLEEGPLLILAGPDSGKTLVMTKRMERLIQSAPKKYHRVLGLITSARAIDVMKRRLRRTIDSTRDRVRIYTFKFFLKELSGSMEDT